MPHFPDGELNCEKIDFVKVQLKPDHIFLKQGRK